MDKGFRGAGRPQERNPPPEQTRTALEGDFFLAGCVRHSPKMLLIFGILVASHGLITGETAFTIHKIPSHIEFPKSALP